MRLKIVTIFALLWMLPAITMAHYKQENDIPYTESSDAYAQERCKLDVYYSTELKDVTLYEMQGYDHGAMPQPAYYILKQHIKRLTAIIKAKETGLPRTETPTNVAKAMEGFLQGAATEKKDIHSVMIVKGGNVIYSRWQSKGEENTPHVLHSVSKTFTATAVGLAISEGKMALTDKVIDYFPDKLPANVSKNLKAMTVRDLLTMSCGHDVEPSVRNAQQDWVTAFLAHPVVHKPGKFYLYK